MSQTQLRARLRRGLEAHLDTLGYTAERRISRVGAPPAEIARISEVRGRLVYGETVLGTDLRNPRCHERLIFFAQRRTRRRSQILFFIGVETQHRTALETLLVDLGIRSAVRGGHVQVIAFDHPAAPQPQRTGSSRVRRAKPATRQTSSR